MADYPIATHLAGYTIRQTVINGLNAGSKTISTGMIVYNKTTTAAGAAAATVHGRTGVTYYWAPASDAAAADLECKTWGVALTGAAVGSELKVCIAGNDIPALMETTSGETSLLAHAPLYIDHADDELISRAFAVTKTGLAQTIRFRLSKAQTTTASADNTVYVDVEGVSGFGYGSGA